MVSLAKKQAVEGGKSVILYPACPVCGYSLMLVDWKFAADGSVQALYQCHSDYCGGGEFVLDGNGKVIGEQPKKLRMS